MTTKTTLTETQRQVLEQASEQPDGRITWFPDTVKGGALTKVLTGLASKGWITECRGHWYLAAGAIAALERDVSPPVPTMPAVLNRDDANTRVDDVPATPCATEAEESPHGTTTPAEAANASDDPHANVPDQTAVKPPRTRENSKQATVIAMLQRPEGATITQICETTGWQSHTVRGTFAGAFKKKLGLTITSEKPQGGERNYRIG